MRVVTTLPLGDWRQVGLAAMAAEAAGFDGVQSIELAHDPFAPLALAALATKRIGLATGIAVAFPRSPMIVAGQAWDLQAQSGGRFHLGLGTQVRGYNVRRFSVPWSPPQPRLREYIEALRAIWRCWEHGEALNYEGEHYRFTLMTPEFSPPATGLPMVPVSIAAVGPAMLRMAGRICDGVRLHGFCTRRYMEEVCLQHIGDGLAKTGRAREDIEVIGGGFIATGASEDAVRKIFEWARYRVAFYGSTPAYHGVLELHEQKELGEKLHTMSRKGEWDRMAAEVPDDVVDLFCAAATHDKIAGVIEQRFGGIADTISLDIGEDTAAGLGRELIADIKRIPTRFADPRAAA